MPKTVNYSAELTAQIIEDYQNGSSVEEISSNRKVFKVCPF